MYKSMIIAIFTLKPYPKIQVSMASILHFGGLFLFSWIFTIIGKPTAAAEIFRPSRWALAHATFYGDETASATMGTLIIPHGYIYSINDIPPFFTLT